MTRSPRHKATFWGSLTAFGRNVRMHAKQSVKTSTALIVAAACLTSVALMPTSAFAKDGGAQNGSAKTETVNLTDNATETAQADETGIATASETDGSGVLTLGADEIKKTTIEYQKPENGGLYGGWNEVGDDQKTCDADKHCTVDLDVLNKGGWRYRVTVDFVIDQSQLTAGKTKTLVYSIPGGLDVLYERAGLAKDGETGAPIGTYKLTKDGRFVIKLYDNVAQGNLKHALKGTLYFEAQVSEKAKKSGKDFDLPGGGVTIRPGKLYDLHVAKEKGTMNRADKTLPFTVTVSSDYGTDGPIKLNDYMTNGSEVANTRSLKKLDANGKESNVTPLAGDECAQAADETYLANGDADGDTHFTGDPSLAYCLPQLNAGERYVLSYTAKSTLADGVTSGNISNDVRVSSSDGKGGHNNGKAHVDGDWFSTTPTIDKVSEGQNADGDVNWTVTVNKDAADLAGWTVSDTPGEGIGNPHNATLYLVKADGSLEKKGAIGLPYTFPATEDHSAYVIKYTTTLKGDDIRKSYDNTSKVCKPATGEDKTCNTAIGYYDSPNPLYKTGVGTPSVTKPQYSTEEIATIQWQAYINKDSGSAFDVPGRWTFTDELQQVSVGSGTQPQYMTKQQQETLKINVAEAFRKAGLNVPDITFSGDAANGKATGFTLHSDQRIPKNTTINFAYASTCSIGDGTSKADFTNKMNLGQLESWGWAGYTPPSSTDTPDQPDQPDQPSQPKIGSKLVKFDATDGGGLHDQHDSTTAHEYDELASLTSEQVKAAYSANGIKEGTRYLTWMVSFMPGDDLLASWKGNDVKSLTFTEYLPQGTKLLPGCRQQGDYYENDKLGSCVSGLSIDTVGWRSQDGNGRFEQSTDTDYVLRKTQWNDSDFDGNLAEAKVDAENNAVTITLPARSLKWLANNCYSGTKQGDAYRQTITLKVRAAIVGDTADKYQSDHEFANDVTVSYDGKNEGESEQTQKIARDDYKHVIDKQNMSKSGNQVTYQLNVNPDKLCVGASTIPAAGASCSPEKYSFDDIARYEHIEGKGSAELVLEPGDLQMYRTDGEYTASGSETMRSESIPVCSGSEPTKWSGCLNPNGGDSKKPQYSQAVNITKCPTDLVGDAVGGCLDVVQRDESGNPRYVRKISYVSGSDASPEYHYDVVMLTKPMKVTKLGTDEYAYTMSLDHPYTFNGIWTNKLTFTVPNQQNIIIQYRYTVLGDNATNNPGMYPDKADPWVPIDNKVTLMGKTATPYDENIAVNLGEEHVKIAGAHISVYKVDDADNSKALTDAKFQLYVWKATGGNDGGEGEWVPAHKDDSVDKTGNLTVGTGDAVILNTARESGEMEVPSEDGNDTVKVTINPGEALLNTNEYPALTYNHAYALKEIQAPNGYREDTNLHQFMIYLPLSAGTAKRYPLTKPYAFVDGGEFLSANSVMYFANNRIVPVSELPLTGLLGGARWMLLAGAGLLVIAGGFAYRAYRNERKRELTV